MITIIICITVTGAAGGGGLRHLAMAKGAGYAKPGRQRERVAPTRDGKESGLRQTGAAGGPGCAKPGRRGAGLRHNRGRWGVGRHQIGVQGGRVAPSRSLRPGANRGVSDCKSLPQGDDTMW